MVSLLEMLRFAASDFQIIAMTMTQLQELDGLQLRTDRGTEEFMDKIGLLVNHAQKIGMRSTIRQVENIRDYFSGDLHGKKSNEVALMIRELQVRIHEDLEERIMFVIPGDKAPFVDAAWLENGAIATSFPTTALPEMRAAARCYAYGEDTACMFHLMRVVDFGLRRVAESIMGVDYSPVNWNAVGSAIQTKMEQKYQKKPAEWKKAEPFYAGILMDIQAISRGHRNAVIHDLEKNYAERDSRYMLTVVQAFMEHLAAHGMKEPGMSSGI